MLSLSVVLIFVSAVIFVSVFLNNASTRIGVPFLLAFLLLGMLFGSTGLVSVGREQYGIVEKVCSAALIFIMFYGGFGTSLKAAKCVMTESILLSSLGVLLTALFTGLFCYFCLRWELLESFLMGSVVASTDAATVFSILRGRRLGLKNNSAPMLEVESGSNDPMSYLLTVVCISLIGGDASAGRVIWIFFAQILFGIGFGVLVALLATWVFRHVGFSTSGFSSLFMLGVALVSYALPDILGGNGYLSAYIAGIALGNTRFREKKELVHFFDGITSLMQVIIFFVLGLLARPSGLVSEFFHAIAIFFFMLLVARPLAVVGLLSPFRKFGWGQQALVSFAGLRGASSIVFAVVAVAGTSGLDHDIFSVVFCIVLLSISLQGGLLPAFAKRFGQIDEKSDVMKTFSDFGDENDMQFTEVKIDASNPWCGRSVASLGLPRSILMCLVVKKDGRKIVPNGRTVLEVDDTVIFCTMAYVGENSVRLIELEVRSDDRRLGKKVSELPFEKGEQLIMIRRDGHSLIPYGGTVVRSGDVLVINKGAALAAEA